MTKYSSVKEGVEIVNKDNKMFARGNTEAPDRWVDITCTHVRNGRYINKPTDIIGEYDYAARNMLEREGRIVKVRKTIIVEILEDEE